MTTTSSVLDSNTTTSCAARLDELFRPFDRSDSPGLVVGVAHRNQPIYRRGFGLASVRHGLANTPTTRMRIASASKQFTCLAILLLAEEGRLELDAPADLYLKGLPAPRGRPTLRDFMTHMSGLRCTLEMSGLANGTTLQPRDWQSRAVLRQGDAHFAPGHGQLYCNGTYHLLSTVIDIVAGQPFERFMSERVFGPLGMRDTASVPDETFMEPGSAALHVPAPGGGWRSAPMDAEIRGDGGIVSTIDDLLRWLAHVREARAIFSPSIWQQLLAPAVLANGLRSVYGLGLKRTMYRGVEVVHHSGGLYGLNSQVITVPAHGLDIAIMVNGAPASATRLAWSVIDVVLEEELKAPAPVFAAIEPFKHLVGAAYRDPNGFVIGFEEVDGKLGVCLSGMDAAPVLRDEGDMVRIAFEDVGMGPIVWTKGALDNGGLAPDSLTGYDTGQPKEWARLGSDSTPDLATLWAGAYRSDELAADARVECKDVPTLVMRGDYSGERRFVLKPLGGSVFAASGLDGATERFIVRAGERWLHPGRLPSPWNAVPARHGWHVTSP